MTVDMGPPEVNGPKVPSTLPTNADGVVLKEPIQVRLPPGQAHDGRKSDHTGGHVQFSVPKKSSVKGTSSSADTAGRHLPVHVQKQLSILKRKVDGKEWEVTCVSMGNPHAVVFVPDVAALDLPTLGPQFETHPSFPAKINTEFVQVGAYLQCNSIRGVLHVPTLFLCEPPNMCAGHHVTHPG